VAGWSLAVLITLAVETVPFPLFFGGGRSDALIIPGLIFISFRWFSEQLHRVVIDADLEEGGDHDIILRVQSIIETVVPWRLPEKPLHHVVGRNPIAPDCVEVNTTL
jgi:hypothetical protein